MGDGKLKKEHFRSLRILAMAKSGHAVKVIADTIGCSKRHVQTIIARGEHGLVDPSVTLSKGRTQ